MEKEAVVKVEDSFRSSSFSDYFQPRHPDTGLLNFSINDGEKSSLGFMELLGIQEFGSSIFDMLQIPVPSMESPPSLIQTQTSQKPESSEVLNQPTTPNSSSISSASSGAPNADEQTKAVEDDDEEEEQEKTKKLLKPKKTNQKRQREPRFAFMTKSEVDHLEDGYRWRKYGQKAVKNSPFPRSYYRCTTASCNVKKRVERSVSDPSIVVTTYEGQHIHPSPVMPRPSPTGFPPVSGISAAAAAAFSLPVQMILSHQPQFSNLAPFNCGYMTSPNPAASLHDQRRFCTPASALLRDHGLLQDVVPSIRHEE